MSLGAIPPTHLTFRDLYLSGKPWSTQLTAPGFSFTVDFGAHILSDWVRTEFSYAEWRDIMAPAFERVSINTTQQRMHTAANVGRAILGLMQLTLEGHITCDEPALAKYYVPKYAAETIWAHAEQAIRSLGPCIGCVVTNHRRMMCPNLGMSCLLGPNAAPVDNFGPRSD